MTVTESLSPTDIASLWCPNDIRIASDGRHVAWSASVLGAEGEHDESGLWVAALDDDGPARRWTHAANDTTPRWAPDSRRLAFCSDRKERGTAGLYVLDVGGGEAEPLVVRKRDVTAPAWSPDGESIVFLAADEPDEEDERREKERDDADVYGERWPFQRLHRVSVATGEAEVLWDPDLHVTEVAWSPDGTRLAVLTQDTPQIDDGWSASIWVVSADGADAWRLCPTPWQPEDLAWTRDGTRLVYVTTHRPRATSGWTVWAVGVEEGAEPVVIGPQRDEPRCGVGVRVVPGDDRVVIGIADGLGTRLEWCDPADGSRETIWDSPGDIDAYDVASGGVVAAVAHRLDRWPEVWAGPIGRLRVRSNHGAPLDGKALGSVEDFTYTAADGRELDGILIRPPEPPDGPAPTIVLPHGGPYGRSGRSLQIWSLNWGQLLATAGYVVVKPNYRGGLGHGDEFAALAEGDMGGAEFSDVLAAVDAAVERGIADPDRLGIGGWSQGGFLTAWAVTQTDRFGAAVMGAGVSDWNMMALTSDLPTFEGQLGGSLPWDGPGPHRAVERSPISYAAQCTTPLLILHGQQDERVPVSQAIGFHRALRDRDVPVELVTYPREPHGIKERRHQEDLMRRVLEFFDRWLPAGDAGS